MRGQIITSTRQKFVKCLFILKADTKFGFKQEWFFQYKGGMLLRVVDDDDDGAVRFKDVPIEEGEMFLLPGKCLFCSFVRAHTYATG